MLKFNLFKSVFFAKAVLVPFLLTLVCSCGHSGSDGTNQVETSNVVNVKSSDSAMNQAMAQAQIDLPVFKKALTSNNPNYSYFAIKQRFDTPDQGGEHMWVSDITFKDGLYYGVLDVVPVEVPKLKIGDSITINLADISDWMFIDKDTIRGAYTTKVMRAMMSEEERAQMDEQSALSYE